MKKMNVCIVTGTRAEFGIWRPVLRALTASRLLRVQLLVTGTHLMREHGKTVLDIEASPWKIDARVPMYRQGEPAARSLSRGIEGIGKALTALKTDLVLVLGDRLEMLAAATAALAQLIPIAHVHGGETAPGIWDEQIRHAITKMAHVHFCATEKARQRIVRMGENPRHVHTVGAPALDWAVHEAKLPGAAPGGENRVQKPLLLLHPSSPSNDVEHDRATMVLDVLRNVFTPTKDNRLPAIGPNNDPGHAGILRAYKQSSAFVGLETSLSQDLFWLGLSTSSLLIGNSSSGILEAATFGVPVVNIGDRQAGRERNQNVIDVGWNPNAIKRAVRKAMMDQAFLRKVAQRKNLYGDGRASERIVRVLEEIAQTKGRLSCVKRFVD